MGNILATKKEEGRNEQLPDEERGGSPEAGGSSSGSGRSRPEWMLVLPRVPPQLRERKREMYDPLLVSLGPYHHGQPQLRRFEKIKDEVTKFVLLNSEDTHLALRRKILEQIDEIRRFYGGVSRDEYDDEALAGMILRDACFILFYMKLQPPLEEVPAAVHAAKYIGILQLALVQDDILRLENQIPWWVIKSVISSTYDRKDEGEALIIKFLSLISFGDYTTLKSAPWKEWQEPLHLLHALRSASIDVNIDTTDPIRKAMDSFPTSRDPAGSSCPDFKFNCRRKKSSEGALFDLVKQPFRSVTELKAKGIHFKRSSNYINDIRFTSHSLYGVLHLPFFTIDRNNIVYLYNVIAMELSPGSPCGDITTTSYVTFMKPLIQDTKDVIELQEKGILMSFSEGNEKIVRLFKEVDSYGLGLMFFDVKKRINEHCNSKAKTWIADLLNSYFRTPWTAIALIAATFLLCLTFLQTYYTMNPRKNGK